MFSSNDTPERGICIWQMKLGAIINLDDITHIECVEKAVGKIPETISCRYNPGGVFKISNDIMDNPGDAKYGMTTEQIFEAFRILKEQGCKDVWYPCISGQQYGDERILSTCWQRYCLSWLLSLKKETGAHIEFINLSGGIGIPYRPDQDTK